jgi:hypothetical protein
VPVDIESVSYFYSTRTKKISGKGVCTCGYTDIITLVTHRGSVEEILAITSKGTIESEKAVKNKEVNIFVAEL